MKLLLLFIAQAGLVALLGFQSINVNRGHAWRAALSSLVIGCASLFVLRTVPNSHDPLELAAYLLGGPAGIFLAVRLNFRKKA